MCHIVRVEMYCTPGRAVEFRKWPADNATDETTRGGGVVHSREDDGARLLNFFLLYNHGISTIVYYYTYSAIIVIIIHASRGIYLYDFVALTSFAIFNYSFVKNMM